MADTAFRGVGGAGGRGGGGGGSISCHNGGGSGAIPWASKAGHIETVFSCEHRPGDPDTLATGSYGSSVKVWHVPTMDLKVRALVGISLVVSPEVNSRPLAPCSSSKRKAEEENCGLVLLIRKINAQTLIFRRLIHPYKPSLFLGWHSSDVEAHIAHPPTRDSMENKTTIHTTTPPFRPNSITNQRRSNQTHNDR